MDKDSYEQGTADTQKIEYHPLEPFFPSNAQVLMLGSFPPKQARWSMHFYYPNMQNDMWRIFGIVFFGDKDHFLEENKKKFDKAKITAFLEEKGIALGDTAKAILRLKDNASDKFLEVVESIDLPQVLQLLPQCRAIVTTGQKATDTLLAQTHTSEPKLGHYSDFAFEGRVIRIYRMPSSSRAYPKPLTEKAGIYRAMFSNLGLLTE